MPDNSNYKIATEDTLTLLLYNQHAPSAAMEEITKCLSEIGVGSVAANAMYRPPSNLRSTKQDRSVFVPQTQSPPFGGLCV